ncbi:MAG: riboflavin biosynthesis protein RibF [Bacteroidales bacterium]|nr:riboflavin biosynthesis protein RibF [Bacteroidales bacterium]
MAVVATGFFDGVHLGHRQVIQTLVSSARQRGEEAIVVTFAQHPRAVLQQDARDLRLLNSPEEKTALLRSLGVDRVEVLPFDRTFAKLPAREYLRTVLQERFGATLLVLGYDNRLGSDRLTPDLISPLAISLGLEVQVVSPASAEFSAEPVVVSSTKIRGMLEQGDVEAAQAMLGYPYSLRGVVVGGKQLGRKLGFPTANLRLYDPLKLVPARGVYLSEVEVLGRRCHGMTNVGDIIETHIFDFDEDIYGLDLRVGFLKRIRDIRSFGHLDALKAQLAEDEKTCLALLAEAR